MHVVHVEGEPGKHRTLGSRREVGRKGNKAHVVEWVTAAGFWGLPVEDPWETMGPTWLTPACHH